MNKKAQAGQEMPTEQLIGIVLAGMIILSVGLVGCNFLNQSAQKDSSQQISDAISILQKSGGGEGLTFVTMDLEDNKAIVFLNPNSNFYYNTKGVLVDNKGYFMKRPVSCKDEFACICTCDGISLASITKEEIEENGLEEDIVVSEDGDGKLVCNKPICAERKDIKFKEKLYMNEVFDDPPDRIRKTLEGVAPYWLNSMIILRSTEVKPGEKGALGSRYIDVAGYMDKDLNEHMQFIMKKNSDNTLSICFKDDCK